MDVYSRKIVGWAVHDDESMERSSELISEPAGAEGIQPDQLVLHSDNFTPTVLRF